MKKTLLLGLVLLMSFYSTESNAQNINSITITDSIECYGDLAEINILVNQTIPPTASKVIVGYYIGSTFIPITSTNNTTVTSINVPGLAAQNYTVRLVDSILYYGTNPNGSNPASIYDFVSVNITQPLQLRNTADQDTNLLCFGDSNAAVTVNIFGGTPPFTISFDGGASVTLPLTTFSSTYTNLSAGTYSISVTDEPGCNTNGSNPPSPTSITIAEPDELDPNGSVTSDYNGEDISCFGAADGIITASVSGGTTPYQYSIDNGMTFQSSAVFSGLSSGTYTIYYIDDNGCDTSEDFTLSDPPDLSGSISISSQVNCFDGCDGELTFQVNNINTGTPGTPPSYTYAIVGGSFQSSPIFPGLCGDSTYSIIVMDANGCQDTTDKYLSEPDSLIFSDSLSDYNGFNISCFGYSDGSIHFQNPSGGNSPYQYSIDGATFTNSMNYPGLSAGNYPVTLQDDNDCETVHNITLTEPDEFLINFTIDSSYGPTNTPISCPGFCDGGISVVPTNGVAPILYDLTTYPTQTSTFWTGLCGDITFGTYTLNATDANGCPASTNITLQEPLSFVYTVDSTPEYCADSNGTASINVTQGGTGAYAYLWDDLQLQSTSTATGLHNYLYWVRVTDANGCEVVEDVFVPEVDISLTFDSVPPCSGGLLGQATANPNGVPPYTYLWDTGGQTTQTITGLSPGYYTVTVTDANLCTITDSVEISSVQTVNVSVDPLNSTLSVMCNGYPSDTITVITTGGSGFATYQYNIPGVFPPQYNNIFSGIYPGTYPIVAVDANGCSDTTLFTISEPDIIYFTATFSDVSCHSGSNGFAWVDSVSGGTGTPYSYTWVNSNSDTISQSYMVTNLIAGTYTVSVKDIYSCASNPQSVSVTINEPTPLVSTTTIINHSSCAGNQTAANGEAQVIASQGTPGYSYSWTGPSWPTWPNGFIGTGSSNNNLWPGTYYVTIVDDTGCIHYDTAVIDPGVNPILDLTVEDVSCFGLNDGTITTGAISGTPPYSFSDDGGSTPGHPYGYTFPPTGPASYFITVIDAEGCTDSDSIFINEPDELVISSLTPQNISCYDSADGQITANVYGGTGSYSYFWNNGGQTTNPAVGLIPSTIGTPYFVIVTDSMGCSKVSSSQPITQPDELIISPLTVSHASCNGGSDGSVISTVIGGTQPYVYSWSGGLDSISNLSAGDDTLTVTDDHGCITSQNFTVMEPAALSIQFSSNSVTCLGGSDGEASAITFGGTGSYYLLWDNGDTTLTVTTFDAGFHTLTVTDDNGCTFTDSVEILEPSQSIQIDSLIISEISCFEANDASIKILATGGYAPYMYSNDNGVTTQNTIFFGNLPSDQYIMYVEDNIGCTDTVHIFIDQPDSLYIDTTIFSPISCNGANDGYILDNPNGIHAFGGTPPYLYSLNGLAYHTSPINFPPFGPGLQTVEVLDANNCAVQDIIIVTEPNPIYVNITTSNWNGYEVQCHGGSNGTANISINGGTGPYTTIVLDVLGNIVYNGNSSIIDNILAPNFGGAGLYTFVITDNSGCEYIEDITYQEPTAITHSFVINHITCTGWSNGSITWNGSGGVGSATTYLYDWSTGDTTYSINGLGIGSYTITVEDLNGCNSNSIAVLDNSSVLDASIGSSQNPSCWNYCDGEIEVLPSGGVPNINSSGNPTFNYQWNDQLSQITQTAIGLCVDDATNSQTFNCIITDALGCTITETVTLTQPDPISVSIASTSDWNGYNISCNGYNDGDITVGTTGGNSGIITYTWNTGQSNPSTSINNLIAGTYVVVAADVNLCMDTLNITLTEPTAIEAIIDDITDVHCYDGSTGEISVTVTGGTWNVLNQYTYDWEPNTIGTPSDIFVNPTGIGTLSGINEGFYSVTVTDINGCEIESNSVYVKDPDNELTIFTDSTDASCLTKGSATTYVLGGTPIYTYLWSPGGQTTATATELDPNTTYTVTVTDYNGCIITDTTYINGYRNVFLPNNDDQIDSTICLGTEVDILVEDQGYEYLWNTGQTTPSITVTPQDFITIYTLSITDPACSTSYEVEAKYTVTQSDINPVATPDPLVLGDQVTIESSYSYDSYQWGWNWIDVVDINSSTYPGYYQNSADGMSMTDYPESSTWYYVEVTDGACKSLDSVYVVVGPVPYDAISPNGDGLNDEWEILDISSYPTAEVQIFNRWGSLIFSSTGENYNNNKWNGEHEGKLLPVGTYYYTINLKDGSELQTGAVTIVR